MRWSIKTKTTDNTAYSATQTERITTTTKTQYITIGDIVGMAKSATGAVKNLVKKLPGYISMFKSGALTDPSSAASANMAQAVYNIASPLQTIIQTSEIYGKVMKTIGVVTPIMKLIARGTGVWCSPGNAADMAEIVIGTVQQILMALVIQAITMLKDWIWNFEFKLRDITTRASVLINKNLRKSAEDINKAVKASMNTASLSISPDIQALFSSGADTSGSAGGVASRESYAQKLLQEKYRKLLEKSGTKVVVSDLSDAVKSALTEGLLAPRYNPAWMTEHSLGLKLRELRGSSNGNGIQYTDIENGKIVWKDSSKKTGSFCCFALLRAGGQDVYLAGGAPYVKAGEPSSDTEWSVDQYGQYNKDYYAYKAQGSSELVKIPKMKKDSYELETAKYTLATGCLDPAEKESSEGIWYSVDNGETWTKASGTNDYIGGIFVFSEKTGYPATAVACSYDYRGMMYSENGRTWTASRKDGKSLDHGRFVSITDLKGDKVRVNSEDQEIGPSAEPETVYTLAHVGAESVSAGIPVECGTVQVVDDYAFYLKNGIDPVTSSDIRAILDYIHANYRTRNGDSEYLRKFDGAFWDTLVSDIKAGKYTMADAVRGERL